MRDVAHSAASPDQAPYAVAEAVFADAKAYLSSREAQQMSESELERELHRTGPGVDAQAPARTPRSPAVAGTTLKDRTIDSRVTGPSMDRRTRDCASASAPTAPAVTNTTTPATPHLTAPTPRNWWIRRSPTSA